jgi:hypothetical protein
VVNLPDADTTPIFANPVSLSFGLLRANTVLTRSIDLTDSGLGGSGPWTVSLDRQTPTTGAAVVVPATITVPGRLDVTVRTTRPADGEMTGYVVLSRGSERLRIPYWFGTGTPALAGAKRGVLRKPGNYKSSTRGGSTRIARYRYPERPVGFGFAATLPGPERVFRVSLARPTTNFGVVVTSRAPGVRVEPRIVKAGDERRLTGYAALPFNLNPYLRTFGELVLAAGTILPAAGSYDVVFDSPSAARAGAFTFRYWVNDVSPPASSLRTPTVSGGRPLLIAASDRSSGVDPASVVVQIDGDEHEGRFARGIVTVSTQGLSKGRHALRFQISDFQESRNMENVSRILPNTRILETTFVVR